MGRERSVFWSLLVLVFFCSIPSEPALVSFSPLVGGEGERRKWGKEKNREGRELGRLQKQGSPKKKSQKEKKALLQS